MNLALINKVIIPKNEMLITIATATEMSVCSKRKECVIMIVLCLFYFSKLLIAMMIKRVLHTIKGAFK